MTGRDRLVWNTAVSWASQITVIMAGFIMPRLMDEKLGQTTLGIWDFAWTFVNYFNLMNLGIGSSVNRFVAKYRTERNHDALNVAVSTVTAIQFGITLLVVLMVLIVYEFIGIYYTQKLGPSLATAQYVVVLLGLSVAVEMLVHSARGVITGHHRWDIHNGLYAASSFLSLLLMATALLMGGGLVSVSIAYLASITLTEVARVALALWVAPEIRVWPKYVSWEQAKHLFAFGIKSLLLSFPQVILVQSVNLVTVAMLGPASLAVFARPFALIRQLYTLVFKFTMMLTPTVGSLQAMKNQDDVHAFFKSTLRFNFAVAIPAIAVFALLGDLVVEVWMGKAYQNWLLMAILAIGHLMAIGQDGIIRIMQGLDMHGRVALYLIMTVVVCTGIVFAILFAQGGQWSLIHSALLLTIPMTVSFGIVVPVYSCIAIGISLFDYIRYALLMPLIYNLPFIVALAVTRLLYERGQYELAIAVFVVGGMTELAAYARYLLPDSFKRRLPFLSS